MLSGERAGRFGDIIPRDSALTICLSIVFYVYFIGFFTYNFGLPVAAYYLTDVLIIACLLLSVERLGEVVFSRRLRLFSILLITLVVVGTFSALLNGFHPLLWLWSARNWGRFFLFFYLCVALFDEEWIDKTLSFTVGLFFVNAVVIIIQFLTIEEISQDALNGLVGRDTSGVNIVLTLAASAIVSAEYSNGRCGFWKVVAVFAGVLIVSVLAELKATMFFAVFVFALVSIVSRSFSWANVVKLIAFVLIAGVAIAVGVGNLNSMYPTSGLDLSIEGLIGGVSAESGYGNNGRIDRLTAVDVINRDIFSGDIAKQVFGVGMGNAEYSGFESLQSGFYGEYGAEYAYLRFSVSMLYIEGGCVGLALYVALFVVLIAGAAKAAFANLDRQGGQRSSYYEAIGFAMACISLIFIWYNNLLRTDISVLMAFYLAVPFAMTKNGAT